MEIEADARKIIIKGIKLEKKLQTLENQEKAKGHIMLKNDEYDDVRSKFVKLLSKLNSIANSEGKGKDNFSIAILLKAEEIMRTVSADQSKAVRRLSERVRKSFQSLRDLLIKYSQNIEILDPQLKNNPDLSSCLAEFEVSWESGSNYFLNPLNFAQIMNFSQVIEGTCEKHAKFNEQVESRSEEIFTTIPTLLILNSLESEQNLCNYFYPKIAEKGCSSYIKYKNLCQTYETATMMCENKDNFYNILEKIILEVDLNGDERKMMASTIVRDYANSLALRLRQLAIEMSRFSPVDWNNFLEIVLSS